MKNTKYVLIAFALLSAIISPAQSGIDSLWHIWENQEIDDSTRIASLQEYIWKGYLFSDPDSAYYLSDLQLTFAKESEQYWGVAAALLNQGICLQFKGDFDGALESYNKGLDISIEHNSISMQMEAYIDLGIVKMNQGDFVEALSYYNKGLELALAEGDSMVIGKCYGNIGGLHAQTGDTEYALWYFKQNLSIAEKLNNERTALGMLNNIGNIYMNLEEIDSALIYYQQSLEKGANLHKELLSGTLNNVGRIYLFKKDYSRALDYFDQSMEVGKSIGSDKSILEPLLNAGMAHFELGNYNRAQSMCEQSLNLSDKFGAIPLQRDACECLYKTHKVMGRYRTALSFTERVKELDVSLNQLETARKLQRMEFDKELLQDSLRQEEEKHKIEMAHQEEVALKDKTRNLLMSGGGLLFLLAIGLYSRNRYVTKSREVIQKEKDRSEELLLNILPADVADELKVNGEVEAQLVDQVTVLFTDFKGFTKVSEQLSAKDLVAEINHCFKAFDTICDRYGIEKIKTIGDAYMAAGGLPAPIDDSVRKTLQAALEMSEFIKERIRERDAEGLISFEMRVGIHTGNVVAGIVGIKKFQYDVWGDTVNTASRMESNGETGKVNISQTTYELIQEDSSLSFEYRGKVMAKGKGEIDMYFVEKLDSSV